MSNQSLVRTQKGTPRSSVVILWEIGSDDGCSNRRVSHKTDKVGIGIKGKKINEECGRSFLRISISSTIEISPVIDNYSTWMLAGSGAIAALMISNVQSIIPFLGEKGFKISIYILVCSAISGLFQKYRSLCVQSFTTIANKIINSASSLNSFQQNAFNELNQEANKHGIQLEVGPEIDIENYRNEVSKLLPFFLRRKALKNFDLGAKDDLHGWRKMIKSFKHQIFYFVLQFVLFLAFFVLAASLV